MLNCVSIKTYSQTVIYAMSIKITIREKIRDQPEQDQRNKRNINMTIINMNGFDLSVIF